MSTIATATPHPDRGVAAAPVDEPADELLQLLDGIIARQAAALAVLGRALTEAGAPRLMPAAVTAVEMAADAAVAAVMGASSADRAAADHAAARARAWVETRVRAHATGGVR